MFGCGEVYTCMLWHASISTSPIVIGSTVRAQVIYCVSAQPGCGYYDTCRASGEALSVLCFVSHLFFFFTRECIGSCVRGGGCVYRGAITFTTHMTSFERGHPANDLLWFLGKCRCLAPLDFGPYVGAPVNDRVCAARRVSGNLIRLGCWVRDN